MDKNAKIYVAGHSGLVGSSIMNELHKQGYQNIIFKTHQELDLLNQDSVFNFFSKERPEYVFLAAAKAGGIMANNTYRADFIYENLQIECNVIHASYLNKVKKLIFIASTTVYPKKANMPTSEREMLHGDLEYTNKPYAISKIAGLIMCESYNIQYGTNFIGITPTNLYGDNDKFDLEKSHVLPGILRKMHLGKLLKERKHDAILKDLHMQDMHEAREYLSRFGVTENSVEIWGSGKPTREFLHSDDLAEACLFVANNIDFADLFILNESNEIICTHLNIGPNENITIKELAFMIKELVGYDGEIFFNTDKPDGVMNKLTDCSKIHSLGWKHKISLEEGIKRMYQWYLNRNKL